MIVVSCMGLHNFILEHNSEDADFARFDRDPNYMPTIPERYKRDAVLANASGTHAHAQHCTHTHSTHAPMHNTARRHNTCTTRHAMHRHNTCTQHPHRTHNTHSVREKMRAKEVNLFKLPFFGVGVAISTKHISSAPKGESSSTVELQIGGVAAPELVWWSRSPPKHDLNLVPGSTTPARRAPL
jgi:hypothetical protein